MANKKKQLLQYFAKLNEIDQHALVSYAEFLFSHTQNKPIDPKTLIPENIPRPDEESVIKAIKRLSATYPMLDKSKMLNEISLLMTEHLIHGKQAKLVIDKLEASFKDNYNKMKI